MTPRRYKVRRCRCGCKQWHVVDQRGFWLTYPQGTWAKAQDDALAMAAGDKWRK